MTMKATARPILKRFGFRNVMIFNGVISAATIAMCAFFTSATPVNSKPNPARSRPTRSTASDP